MLSARPQRFAVSGGLARPLPERTFFRRTVGFARAGRVVARSPCVEGTKLNSFGLQFQSRPR